MARTKFVAGNWKMNGDLAANLSLLNAVRSGAAGLGAEVAVCVPYPYLAQAQSILAGSTVAWGAQDVSEHAQGAFTGEVSASMLNDFGCRYVIVGHSERRSSLRRYRCRRGGQVRCGAGGWPDADPLRRRDAGGARSRHHRAGCDATTRRGDRDGRRRCARRAVVAYEPVWAIGTGKTATPAQAQEVHALIRARVAQADADGCRRPADSLRRQRQAGQCQELFGQPDIDGGLIGGASLVAGDFLAICAAG